MPVFESGFQENEARAGMECVRRKTEIHERDCSEIRYRFLAKGSSSLPLISDALRPFGMTTSTTICSLKAIFAGNLRKMGRGPLIYGGLRYSTRYSLGTSDL